MKVAIMVANRKCNLLEITNAPMYVMNSERIKEFSSTAKRPISVFGFWHWVNITSFGLCSILMNCFTVISNIYPHNSKILSFNLRIETIAGEFGL